jgi:hypothetical protein
MKLSKWMCAVALGFAVVGGPAEAKVVIDIVQSGDDVVATGSGALDLTDLTLAHTETGFGGVDANVAGIIVGSFPGATSLYTGLTGPVSFGTGDFFSSSSGSGDILGVVGNSGSVPVIFVPDGYVSGSPLSGSSTYDGQTLASLGLTRGTYVYTWGSGADADSLTVNIGAAATPEPATWAMMLLGFAGLGFAGHRATRKSAALGA